MFRTAFAAKQTGPARRKSGVGVQKRRAWEALRSPSVYTCGVPELKELAVCPHCGSTRVRRSKTLWWERPRRWFSKLVPYRCDSCGWRGWKTWNWDLGNQREISRGYDEGESDS